MSNSSVTPLDDRILVLAPTTRDATLTCVMLDRAGLACMTCENMGALVEESKRGAGAILISEEHLITGPMLPLVSLLADQPPWSDLPIILLTRHGADSPEMLQSMRSLGNVTLLERPARMNALLSAVRAALRARHRQYQARATLLEREQAAEALRRSEHRYRTLVEQVKDYAIFMADPAGRATSWNEGVKRVLGFDQEDFLGSDIQRIFTPEDQAAGIPNRELLEAAQTGAAGNDRWMQRKDGVKFWASGVTSALRDSEGTLLGFTKVLRDLTEQKRAEDALKQADRRKDEFLATLAHELRNPLAPIRNSLNILQLTYANEPTASRICEMMERQVTHMVRLVDDLLEVSRITRGQIELRKERTEIAAVVRSAVETSTPLIEAAGHQLSISLPPEAVYVHGDSVRLAQVIANLLNNAAKYTNSGGQIWLSARRDQQRVLISVRDSGIGIPPAMQPKIFDLFTQVDRAGGRSQGGLGIGLTLVRSLVEMHDGSIEVRSQGEGQGTEFIVRMPCLIENPPAVQNNKQRAASVLGPQRILVVDDNRDAATSLGMLLKFLGADVRVVHDGESALEAVEDYHPAVVLLDIGMPGMDGFEVARRVRAMPEARDILLIALTGWGQEDDRRRTHAAGFDHHLVKPADLKTLQAILATQSGH